MPNRNFRDSSDGYIYIHSGVKIVASLKCGTDSPRFSAVVSDFSVSMKKLILIFIPMLKPSGTV